MDAHKETGCLRHVTIMPFASTRITKEKELRLDYCMPFDFTVWECMRRIEDVRKRNCAQASMFTSGCVHIHAHVYTYREGGMRSFMKEMTLVIGPYMEQKTRPMEQIMHCKSCSLGHCGGSVDKLRASSVESSPLPPVPMLMGLGIGSS